MTSTKRSRRKALMGAVSLLSATILLPITSYAFQTAPASSRQRARAHETRLFSEESPSNPNEKKKSLSLLRLAELSLKDYDWRSSVFKSTEADRKVEESLARMMGETPSYVRPMDASEEKIGPLGVWEKTSVDWLRRVIEEEATRAKQIVKMGGILVRPYETEAPDGELGPLGFMEKQFVDFLEKIRQSERERSKSKTLRPMYMDESMRGPLGEAEFRAVQSIREILDAEKLRVAQSKLRSEVVRPIDVPGPLGDLEMKILEVIEAERQRKVDRESNPSGSFVRPKDASKKGPLGELEEQAVAVVQKLTGEEKERLRNINRYLNENRPMELNKNSVLGFLETVAVGIVRAPILMYQIFLRVSELLQAETLDTEDSKIVEKSREKAKKSKGDR
mmetsp:Transcript_8059/g.22976  ORF Transcript_8059/g.22976 Transcript_8059/m.22976 type:complete len:392 (-) Transcript_8059:1579-2754(-)|eukprot:CAMPEP_0176029050 /NCGR_PEP_ID=MMETSP0120_2-20121206/14269_1 /TAXON_ID=160619 /ORGANISM="Kryptoperidinium foliaceum, Strain CCMP 1326" /LENGTH=391 /DNA_ID=CAMNT_0017362271 /DNA_START=113 /DNA_END=1288 /DNA_ORIENTATION=-